MWYELALHYIVLTFGIRELVVYKLEGRRLVKKPDMALALGNAFTLLVTNDGDIYSFGDNASGQLGINNTITHRLPTLLDHGTVFDGKDVVMVSAGDVHSSCITSDGSLWLWGYNRDGGLGLGDFNNRLVPVRIPRAHFNNSHVLMVACGCSFTVVLTIAGKVWTCGDGELGQLGHGNQEDQNQLIEIDAVRFQNMEIGMVAVGTRHSLAITRKSGILYTWGSNTDGQLGLGYKSNYVTVPCAIPQQDFDGDAVASMHAHADYTMAVSVDGDLWACGGASGVGIPGTGSGNRQSSTMIRIGGDELFGEGGVRMVSCGSSYALIVACNGLAWSTQRMRFRVQAVETEQDVGDPYRPCVLPRALFGDEDVLVAGATHTHNGILTRSGRLYTWGENMQQANSSGIGYDLQVVMQDGDWFPQPIPLTAFQNIAVGRWHRMTTERAEALIMGRYAHFAATGEETAYSDEKFKDDVLQAMMEDLMLFKPPKTASPGLKNMLGVAPS